VALVSLTLLLVTAGDAGAQDGTTEPSVPELIVPGAPSVTSGPAETPSSTTAVPAEATSSRDDGLAASTKVWIIIGGLVGVAFLVLILTILYWRRTKPSAVAARRAAKAEAATAGEASEGGPPAPVGADTAPVPASDGAPPATQTAPPAAAPPSRPAGEVPASEEPRPVGDEAPVDPRRSVFAPPPGDEPPAE
jgi:hypothetical protein